jgi:hypothetical protein
MANSLAWSIDPNAFLKWMYRRYISCWVSLESSRVAIRICNCLDVHLSCLNPSWLFGIFCHSWPVGL